MFTTLFAAASAPATFEWSPKCAVVMIACNVFAYAIARANVELPINVNIPWSVTNPYNTSWLS